MEKYNIAVQHMTPNSIKTQTRCRMGVSAAGSCHTAVKYNYSTEVVNADDITQSRTAEWVMNMIKLQRENNIDLDDCFSTDKMDVNCHSNAIKSPRFKRCSRQMHVSSKSHFRTAQLQLPSSKSNLNTSRFRTNGSLHKSVNSSYYPSFNVNDTTTYSEFSNNLMLPNNSGKKQCARNLFVEGEVERKCKQYSTMCDYEESSSGYSSKSSSSSKFHSNKQSSSGLSSRNSSSLLSVKSSSSSLSGIHAHKSSPKRTKVCCSKAKKENKNINKGSLQSSRRPSVRHRSKTCSKYQRRCSKLRRQSGSILKMKAIDNVDATTLGQRPECEGYETSPLMNRFLNDVESCYSDIMNVKQQLIDPTMYMINSNNQGVEPTEWTRRGDVFIEGSDSKDNNSANNSAIGIKKTFTRKHSALYAQQACSLLDNVHHHNTSSSSDNMISSRRNSDIIPASIPWEQQLQKSSSVDGINGLLSDEHVRNKYRPVVVVKNKRKGITLKRLKQYFSKISGKSSKSTSNC